MTSEPTDDQIVTHDDPAWESRANFIVMAAIEGENLPRNWEQLWARLDDGGRLKICCIPFYIYDLALGDVVECIVNGPMEYAVGRVLEPSGHWTFRAFFGDSSVPESNINAHVWLQDNGYEFECWSSELMAIDAAGEDEAKVVEEYLQGCQERGELLYERAKPAFR